MGSSLSQRWFWCDIHN